MTQSETTFKPMSGYIGLLAMFIIAPAGIALGIMNQNAFIVVAAILIFIFLAVGLTAVSPNGSRVLTLFGAYKGTVRKWILFY